jgi:hypothetical protein
MAMIAIAIMTSSSVNPPRRFGILRGAPGDDFGRPAGRVSGAGTTLLLRKGEIFHIALVHTHRLKKGVKDKG